MERTPEVPPVEEKPREELDPRRRRDGGEGTHEDEPSRPPSRRALFAAAAIMVLAAVALFLVGYLPRHRRDQQTEAEARREREALPGADVVKVKQSPPTSALLLPGNITPITEAYIYARASGYLRRRYVDFGDRVRAGQLLAEIEAPELDAQVQQARAAVSQAEQQLGQSKAALEQLRAQLALAKANWNRYNGLVDQGAVSRQDAETQFAAYRSAEANLRAGEASIRAAEQNIAANRANLERLIHLQSFEKVTAPFSGIVTARNVDVGALISASGSGLAASSVPLGGTQAAGALGTAPSGGGAAAAGGSGGEMFRIAQIERLRILINVPQQNAPAIRVGLPAELFVQEFSKRKFEGRVTRTASALDMISRTMLTEVQLSNPDHALLPGMYAQVRFLSTRSDAPLLVPGDALIARADGIFVAVLQDPSEDQLARVAGEQQRRKAKRIHIQKVEVGRDYGTETEIMSGLQGSEYVTVNPSDAIREGALIVPTGAPPAEKRSERSGAPRP